MTRPEVDGAKRDGNGTVSAPGASKVPAVPSTSQEFGAGLRALRTVGLRCLASEQTTGGVDCLVLSKSQLARYESGETLPPLKYADHLDGLYQAEGWVTMSLHALWRPRWNPWAAEHGVAKASHAGQMHRLTLDWGPWTQDIQDLIEAHGIVLLTGKSAGANGVAVTCNLTSSPSTFALFGVGENLEGEKVKDIRRDWHRTHN